MHKSRFRAFAVAISLGSSLFAQGTGPFKGLPAVAFPDTSAVRARLFSTLLGAPRDSAQAYGERIEPSPSGRVRVITERRGEDLFVRFLGESDGDFPEYGRGSYEVQRSGAKGLLAQAKVFLQDDPGCYARLYAQGESTRVDVVMFGAVVRKGLSAPGMFYRSLTRPFSEIVEATRGQFDWKTVFDLGPGPAIEMIAAVLSLDPAYAQELSEAPPKAVGFVSDSGEFGTKLPYAPYPKREANAGYPIAAIRSRIYLDYLSSGGSAYLVQWPEGQAAAFPAFDGTGAFRISFHGSGGEAGLEELLGSATKARVYRATP